MVTKDTVRAWKGRVSPGHLGAGKDEISWTEWKLEEREKEMERSWHDWLSASKPPLGRHMSISLQWSLSVSASMTSCGLWFVSTWWIQSSQTRYLCSEQVANSLGKLRSSFHFTGRRTTLFHWNGQVTWQPQHAGTLASTSTARGRSQGRERQVCPSWAASCNLGLCQPPGSHCSRCLTQKPGHSTDCF